MKKLIFIFAILVVLLFAFSLQAKDKDMRWVYHGGLSLTPGSSSLSPHLGFSGLVGLETPLNDHFSYEIGLMISPLTLSLNDLNLPGNYQGSLLSIPLYFKYRLFTGSTPFLLAGPEIGYIFGLQNDQQKMDSFNHLYYGLTIGAGYEFKIRQNMTVAIAASHRLPLSKQ